MIELHGKGIQHYMILFLLFTSILARAWSSFSPLQRLVEILKIDENRSRRRPSWRTMWRRRATEPLQTQNHVIAQGVLFLGKTSSYQLSKEETLNRSSMFLYRNNPWSCSDRQRSCKWTSHQSRSRTRTLRHSFHMRRTKSDTHCRNWICIWLRSHTSTQWGSILGHWIRTQLNKTRSSASGDPSRTRARDPQACTRNTSWSGG